MAVVIFVAARWIARQFSPATADARCWITGVVARVMTVAAELLLVVVIAGRSVAAHQASRDPLSGRVYIALLIVFAAMPCRLLRR